MTDREKTASESSGKASSKRHKSAASEEVKAKFREALERKSAHGGTAAAADGESKVHDSHGPAASQRMFRRKSGG
ncbi:MAG: DUF5302 domain-containing protein [Dermatophilaceae bacterium]